MKKLPLIPLLAALCTGCVSDTGGGRDRFLRSLKPVANPGQVIATELAFARAAQDKGQWTAFSDYAADGALIFGKSGAFEAKPWLKQQANPAKSVTWNPHALWSSCDGSLAVTRLGFAYPDNGPVGVGFTVWQRQKKGEYRYLFDFGWATKTPEAEPDIIDAKVADCAKGAAPADAASDVQRSSDGTLQWTFAYADEGSGEGAGEGTRSFSVWMLADGALKQVAHVSIPPQGR